MPHLTRRIKRISKLEYAERKRILSRYVNFSFKTRIHFNRGQKSAITKAWSKYENLLSDIQKGTARFKPIKKSLLRKIKLDYAHTNKGVFIYDRDKHLKIKATKKELIFIRQNRTEIFLPYPKDSGLTFTEWALMVITTYKFDYMALRIGMNHGYNIYDPIMAERYLERDISRIEAGYTGDGREIPFTGIFLIFTGGVKFRKAVKIKELTKRKLRYRRYFSKRHGIRYQ